MEDKKLRNRINKIRDALAIISDEINNIYCDNGNNLDSSQIKKNPDKTER